VRRVSVVGVSGSGKSTLGRELAGRLAVPFVELDAIFHQPEWTPLPEEQFRDRVTAITAGDGWVIDGNYTAILPAQRDPGNAHLTFYRIANRADARQLLDSAAANNAPL
jgi:adenylate kinase family enzyme